MRGRKKLPTEIKLLKGTLRADREIKDAMNPTKIIDLPYPPEYLNEDAKKEWYVIIKEYQKLGMISNLDLGILGLYCNEISIYIEMTNKLRDKDRVRMRRGTSPRDSTHGQLFTRHAPNYWATIVASR